jgi:hypothetical protein
MSEQQRLTAMEHDMNLIEMMNPDVLGDTPGRLGDCCSSYDFGLVPPALISMLEDVAVIAGKVTPAAYLDDVLTNRT